jgi:hypothetical protein
MKTTLEKIKEYCRARGNSLSMDQWEKVPTILKEVYSWGACDLWDLTCGQSHRHMAAVHKLIAAGLMAEYKSGAATWVRITEEAMEFIEEHELFPDVVDP